MCVLLVAVPVRLPRTVRAAVHAYLVRAFSSFTVALPTLYLARLLPVVRYRLRGCVTHTRGSALLGHTAHATAVGLTPPHLRVTHYGCYTFTVAFCCGCYAFTIATLYTFWYGLVLDFTRNITTHGLPVAVHTLHTACCVGRGYAEGLPVASFADYVPLLRCTPVTTPRWVGCRLVCVTGSVVDLQRAFAVYAVVYVYTRVYAFTHIWTFILRLHLRTHLHTLYSGSRWYRFGLFTCTDTGLPTAVLPHLPGLDPGHSTLCIHVRAVTHWLGHAACTHTVTLDYLPVC